MKANSQEIINILKKKGITKLYHFTDRDNLQSIIDNGGLHSWKDCQEKGINIPKPGGSSLSWDLDSRKGLEHYVRTSFVHDHPMMFVAMNDDRISNPVILEISVDVIKFDDTLFSDSNAASNGVKFGGSTDDVNRIHFDLIKSGRRYFDMNDDEKSWYQAEVMVKNFIPLEYITNIYQFGISIPQKSTSKNQITIQAKSPYTAQITRQAPTAFIFLVDHSVSMKRTTNYQGEEMTLAAAVARIVNDQIDTLVKRCIKNDDTRHYYDIALIGYGENVYSAWEGKLSGRDFVSPVEIKENPYKTITTTVEKRTRKGIERKEVTKQQWIEAKHNGSWTHVHKAFEKAKNLIEKWVTEHPDSYPPTIINITDGEFNGLNPQGRSDLVNSIKSIYTSDGNVLVFNIHVTPSNSTSLMFPITRGEVSQDKYSLELYSLSSLLPTVYSPEISELLQKGDKTTRFIGMGVNGSMSDLTRFMNIGTLTTVNNNRTTND